MAGILGTTAASKYISQHILCEPHYLSGAHCQQTSHSCVCGDVNLAGTRLGA